LVQSLVTKSLLAVEADDVAIRYRLLDTIRDFALKQLDGAEERAARDRHRAHFASIAMIYGDLFKGPEQIRAARALERAHDNIRAALADARADDDWTTLNSMVDALTEFWNIKQWWNEAESWLRLLVGHDGGIHARMRLASVVRFVSDEEAEGLARGALTDARATGDARLIYEGVSTLSLVLKGYAREEARALARDSVPLAETIGDARLIANAHGARANTVPDSPETLDALERAIELQRTHSARSTLANMLISAGRVARAVGRMDVATRHTQEALDLARALDAPGIIALALNNLGTIAWTSSRLGDARALFEESVTILKRSGGRDAIGRGLYNLALIARDGGRLDDAEAKLREALAIWKGTGYDEGRAFATNLLGVVLFEKGDRAGARASYEDSVAVCQASRLTASLASVLVNLATLDGEEGDVASARVNLERSHELSNSVSAVHTGAEATLGLGRMALLDGDPDTAERWFKEMLERAMTLGNDGMVVSACEGLARVAVARGNGEHAARLFGAASALWESLGAVRPPQERRLLDDAVGEARALAGGAAYDIAASEGATLSRDELIAYALYGELPHALSSRARPRTAPATVPAAAGEFRTEGDTWAISFAGRAVRLRDSKGMRYIAYLLGRPALEIHASDLVAAIAGIAPATNGSADDILDPRARAELKRKIVELETEIAEATDWDDEGRAERAREELEQVTRALGTAYGLGGRARKAGDPAERARKAVTQRVKESLARIRDAHEDLGRHLDVTIRTGVFCSYNPDRPIEWTT
ncbi:MAG: tetratricopeptide repeat protein, partial [Actinobacteria bacterium]|nr:tetratricopeptide repeat protein [Actinomycetota bacterium]